METAKVDVRKLQILNDRINQTIDALQQVRLSVHGLQSTPGIATPWLQNAQTLNPALNPYSGFYAQSPLHNGLSHTSPLSAFGQYPFGISSFGIGSPYTNSAYASSPYAMNPLSVVAAQYSQTPWMNPALSQTGGLSHTSVDPTLVDPYWAMRVRETFPFAFVGQGIPGAY